VILVAKLLPPCLETEIKIGGGKKKNVLTNSRNRRRCSYYVGSNAIELCSSHGGISESIGGKLPGQFKETVFESVAAASGYRQ